MQQWYGFGPSTPEDLCISQVFDVILSFAHFLRLSQFHMSGNDCDSKIA